MKEEFVTLAHSWNGEQLDGWYYSRKLNGWGCVWDGGISRGLKAAVVPWYYQGGDKETPESTGLFTIGRADKFGIRPKVIHAPNWWIDKLPKNIPLHGELWCDDDLAFIKSVCGQGIAGRSDPRWSKVKFMVYNSKPFGTFPLIHSFLQQNNIPLESLINRNNFTWSCRMHNVKMILEGLPADNVEVVKQTRMTYTTSMEELATMVDNHGWEGLMFVNPFSYYANHRSKDLLKYKPEFETEATVVGYANGNARHIGRMGAIQCELTWDMKVTSFTGGLGEHVGRKVNFEIGGGFSDAEREWDYVKSKWPIGGEIHFKFFGITRDGIPFSCNKIGD